MKKVKSIIIIIILIEFLLSILMPISFAVNETLNIENEEIEDYLYESTVEPKQPIKSILNIDTNLNNTSFNNIIHIEGWKLATEANTILEVYIDNQKIDENYIKYAYKYNLISLIQGYGTYKENPKPNFDINIPIDNFKQGNHDIRIKLVSEDGTILQSSQGNIYVDKGIKSILNIDTDLNNSTFNKKGIHIEGWKLSTESNTELYVYIDNKKIDSNYIKYAYKYNLISIVQGYGTYKENPKPNFDIDIPVDNITHGKHSIIIELIGQDGAILQKNNGTIFVDKSIKSILNIDTNLNNATFDKYGIHIEGWKLATEANTELHIYIDNQKIDENYIKYAYKYNLISLVHGYGTYEENPKPNFDIDIPVDNIKHGKHKIEIEFATSDGNVLQKVENTINIDKSIKSILNIDTSISNVTFGKKGIHIEGWKLATEADTKLQVYINNTKIDDSYIKYAYKYNLISLVHGYGTYVENPKPNFDIDIPVKNYSDGKYTLTIKFITADGKTTLEKRDYTIYIKNEYKGIDVSSFNGTVNWRAVKNSGIEFAMIRLGYRGYRNPRLVLDDNAIVNIKSAQAVGIKVGVYFVTQAISVPEAQEEALWVIGTLDRNGIKLDYPVAIDTESSGAKIEDGEAPGRADLLDVETRTLVCRAFSDVIRYNGRIPMIYANTYWFEYKLNVKQLTPYDIWLANYTEPRLSVEYDMWQYSDKGNVMGVLGYVDLNNGYKKY